MYESIGDILIGVTSENFHSLQRVASFLLMKVELISNKGISPRFESPTLLSTHGRVWIVSRIFHSVVVQC